MAKISIIVPVYRVGKYIDKCITSILNQSFKDFEVILIDDGSPDDCGERCDRWAEKDSRIKVVHKENGGVSSARNAGLDVAEGDFISFVDPDDYICEDMLQILYDGIIENAADVATCGVYNVYDEVIEVLEKEEKQKVCDGQEAFAKILEGKEIPAAIWNKLYKRELIGEQRFPIGRIYEDVIFTAELMPKVNKVWMTTKPLYFYVHRKRSYTTETFNPRAMDVVWAYGENEKVVNECFPALKQLAEFRRLWSYFIVMDRILLVKKFKAIDEYKEIKSYLKQNWWKVIKNPYFQKKRKIAVFFMKINVNLYRQLVLLQMRSRELYD